MTSGFSPFSNFQYELILASGSPRRRELLKSLGFDFRTVSLDVDERWPEGLKAQEVPLYLSVLKADSYKTALKSNEILITADTIVWCENRIFNKPTGYDDALAMLKELSGKMHQVFTAVCLTGQNRQLKFYDESKVYFKALTEQEIRFYLDNYKPFDKAGSYGVQDWLGYIGIEKIEGSFYNVMGLPVKPLYEQLMQF